MIRSCWPKGGAWFLDWCENWFPELASGYDIYPTWKFMWQQPGDGAALIRACQNAPNDKYRKGVLWSFQKFPELPEEAVPFLQGLSNPDPEHPDFVEKLLQARAGKN